MAPSLTFRYLGPVSPSADLLVALSFTSYVLRWAFGGCNALGCGGDGRGPGVLVKIWCSFSVGYLLFIMASSWNWERIVLTPSCARDDENDKPEKIPYDAFQVIQNGGRFLSLVGCM